MEGTYLFVEGLEERKGLRDVDPVMTHLLQGVRVSRQLLLEHVQLHVQVLVVVIANSLDDHLDVEGCTDRNTFTYTLCTPSHTHLCTDTHVIANSLDDHLDVEGCTDRNTFTYTQCTPSHTHLCTDTHVIANSLDDHLDVQGCTDRNTLTYTPVHKHTS